MCFGTISREKKGKYMEISFDIFKKHCYADDFDDNDTLLEAKLMTAKDMVLRWLNRTEEETIALNTANDGSLPAPVVEAMYLLGAHLYATREAATTTKMEATPYGLEAMIKSYRKL